MCNYLSSMWANSHISSMFMESKGAYVEEISFEMGGPRVSPTVDNGFYSCSSGNKLRIPSLHWIHRFRNLKKNIFYTFGAPCRIGLDLIFEPALPDDKTQVLFSHIINQTSYSLDRSRLTNMHTRLTLYLTETVSCLFCTTYQHF